MKSKDALFWIEIVCDKCSRVAAGGWTGGYVYLTLSQRKRELMREAKRKGWVCQPRGEFLCPRCAPPPTRKR